jgi:hypothetical protein
MKLIPDTYLGDGIYASFDGYQIWLDTRAQDPVHKIALEPSTMEALDVFRRAVQERIEAAQTEKP